MKYTIIIAVYNRIDEVKELLASAEELDFERNNFEILFVDDGSTDGFKNFIESYQSESGLQIRTIYQKNQGPGAARNNGMKNAKGEYFIFFDSDCLIPKEYFKIATTFLKDNPLDAFGGPDAAHHSFSNKQKAINYAMTSFFTTGGIRGRKKQLSKFQPRSFNMGISKTVFKKIGGFSTIHPGEDPDLSIRIEEGGFKTGLIPKLFVYHKRRIDFKKFYQQVYKFGLVRNILFKWHPQTFKYVFFLPTLFLIGSISLVALGFLGSPLFLIPLLLFTLTIWIDALLKTRSFSISIYSVYASFIQLLGYGWGFLQSFIQIILLKKDEKKTFPKLFFE